MKNWLLLLWLALCLPLATEAQTSPYFTQLEQAIPDEPEKEFQFIAFFYNHYVNSNIYPTNDFLNGQIIGRLFGPNTTTTSDSLTGSYFEQRILPFFIYKPKLFDGKVTLRASLEIDYTWGDAAYGTGGNSGGAVSGDQVNIQTQNVQLEYIPAPGWAFNLGLQRMYDTPYNPYRTFFSDMLHSSYRLHYWGTDGAGLTLRRDADYYRWKAGFFQLYENSIQRVDDVHLFEFNYQRSIGRKWHWGGSAYYVRDRSNGQGGPSILGQGLNSTLAAYNGTYRFPFGGQRYRADVAWLGTYFDYNLSQMADNWFLSGYLNYNLGRTQLNAGDDWGKGPTIGGLGANLRGGYRYGQTPNDAIYVDAMFTSGDDNGTTDGKYSGVMTGNTWGTPAGLNVSSGAYLLFPHANVVNRYVAAITDISNMGLGLVGGTLNLSRDFIPYKLNGKVGLASAISNAEPAQGGRFMGVEGNFKIGYTLGTFMELELHAAQLWLGDFYDSPAVNGGETERPANPFTTLLVFKWLMF